MARLNRNAPKNIQQKSIVKSKFKLNTNLLLVANILLNLAILYFLKFS